MNGEELFQNSLILFLRGTKDLSVGFKIKPLRRIVFLCQDKNQRTFCRKIVESRSFSVWLMNLLNFITQWNYETVIGCVKHRTDQKQPGFYFYKFLY